mgnify:FL=1
MHMAHGTRHTVEMVVQLVPSLADRLQPGA